jgi:hypothetical protein
LATTETLLPRQIGYKSEKRYERLSSLAVTGLLTLVAVLIHGYHPYAEDAGVYLPGVLKLLHPDLYPAWTGFVTAQSRFSLFAPTIAGLVRVSGIGVMTCIFAIYVVSIWATLYSAWHLIARCSKSANVCYGAVSILALCLTTPVAGTSLILMDPYVTARTISTPCSILALVAAIDLISSFHRTGKFPMNSVALCGGSLLIAALMHPLMAAYAAGSVLLLICSSIADLRLRIAAVAAIALLAIATAALMNLLAPPEPAGYSTIVQTRNYWFLSAWRWYEIAGLILPLVLLASIARIPTVLNEQARWLAQMAVSAGVIGIAISLLFVHQWSRCYLVAMLQPLRIFQIIYFVLILLLGAIVADSFLKQNALRWAVTLIPLAALMLFVQIRTFAHSSHLEFPWISPTNDWERAFVWIRDNTPMNSIVALDANYINSPGEDAQNARAITEKSLPADAAKDGGIAAIEPDLASAWFAGKNLQTDLATITDSQRLAKLRPAHVRWLVLPIQSKTELPCPYQNNATKICQTPDH